MDITINDLKLMRGKRKNAELTQLAAEKKDLEYRRLFVEESKLDIIVSYSRSKLFEDIAIIVLFVHALSIFLNGPLFGVSLLFALVMWGVSIIYRIQNKRFIKTTQTTLLLVDGFIKNTYGISLPKYL